MTNIPCIQGARLSPFSKRVSHDVMTEKDRYSSNKQFLTLFLVRHGFGNIMYARSYQLLVGFAKVKKRCRAIRPLSPKNRGLPARNLAR